MSPTFTLSVKTPVKQIFDQPVVAATVPAWEGPMGILAGHAPLVARCRSGTVTLKTSASEYQYDVGEGVLDIGKGGRVTLLVATAVPVERE